MIRYWPLLNPYDMSVDMIQLAAHVGERAINAKLVRLYGKIEPAKCRIRDKKLVLWLHLLAYANSGLHG